MAITIEKEFDVERSPDEVWAFLVDPERVVQCLPGAKLLEAIDERTFRGEIGVRLGPIGASFLGTIHYDELDRDNFQVAMSGNGSDRTGSGSVHMSMRSALAPRDDGGTRVSVTQSLQLAGRLASFGRGGLIEGVADLMFGRFVGCVRRKLEEAAEIG